MYTNSTCITDKCIHVHAHVYYIYICHETDGYVRLVQVYVFNVGMLHYNHSTNFISSKRLIASLLHIEVFSLYHDGHLFFNQFKCYNSLVLVIYFVFNVHNMTCARRTFQFIFSIYFILHCTIEEDLPVCNNSLASNPCVVHHYHAH